MSLQAILRDKETQAATGVLIGLEPGNLERLKQGKPYHLNLAQIGGPNFQVLIMFGESPEKIAAALKDAGAAKPDTPVHDMRNRPKQ